MSGAAWAVLAGISFGIFQAVNRRANTLIDAYRGTFYLLVISVLVLGIVSAFSQDLETALDAPLQSYAWFLGAGVIHFFVGWTLLGLSQQRIGAASTGVVLAATPAIGTILASLFLQESLPAGTAVGVALVTIGVVLIAIRQQKRASFSAVPWLALGAALCWGTSPLFIRQGLEGLDSPLIGVTVGMGGAAALYGVVLGLGLVKTSGPVAREAFAWIGGGGLLVAFAIAAQWTALGLVEVAVVVSLTQLGTPVVVILAPVIVGTKVEKPTLTLLAGMAAVLAGSLLVVWGR